MLTFLSIALIDDCLLVNTDYWPKEISWTLERQTDCSSENSYERVDSRGTRHYKGRNRQYKETVCSEPSKFKFTIADSYGDGIQGRIAVKMDDEMVFDISNLPRCGRGYGGACSKTASFGQCTAVSQSCVTGSKFWEISQDAIRATNLQRSMGTNSLIVLPNDGRRRAKNSAYGFGRETIWSQEQEQWVKKGLAMFTFETCKRKRKGADFLVGSCPEGWYYDGSACWKSCPDWMVSCGTVFCARDTGMCLKKVVDM